ncbi:hypothetical protein PInf_025596 [Phytophthora infestans]|nr:hypothetical protein PInf_025596 [Phytophthora infestans]
MVKLFCFIFGVAGSAFSVEVNESKTVDNLKEVIKAKKTNDFKDFDADKLQLFLAKAGGNAWLSSLTEDVKKLKKGEKTALVKSLTQEEKKLQGEDPISECLEGMDPPEVKQIHVLVVIPGITTTVEVREIKDEKFMAELAYYQRLGQEIQNKCHSCCGAILDKIDTIYEEGSHPTPFICVEGSSGMGKSQLAFSLGGEGRKHPRPWFYWPLLSAGEEMQPVYWNFSSIATAFKSVVEKDGLEKLPKAEILNCTSSFYSTQEIWTYGFIIELLRYSSCADVGAQMIRVENETFEVAKCGLKDVIDARTKMKVLPFFILDEMTASVEIPNKMKLEAFQRNVFRACGLVVIVMGTDAKISNFLSQSQHSRTGSHWWMTVVSNFPNFQSIPFGDPAKEESWQKVINLHPVVKDIADNSRGLFSRYFVDAVVQFALEEVAENEIFALADMLDAAFKAVYVKTQDAKGFMSTETGRDAQLMALSYTNASVKLPDFANSATSGDDDWSEPPPKKGKVGVQSMHVHFANLVDEEITDVAVLGGRLKKVDGTRWMPICRFPVIEEDVLLYLAVLGGKEFSAYYDYNIRKRFSTAGVFDEFRRRIGNEPHGNKNALRNNHFEFENLVAHALFCASRKNGVRGIAFDEFFFAVVDEFQDEFHSTEFKASALLERYAGLKKKFAETMIPFVAPPNARWPDYILGACGVGDGDCNFGHLVRAKDSERLDCYVMVSGSDNPLFVCECKHWKKKLDSGAMEKIVEGLNAECTGRDGQRKPKWHKWDLALVFCYKLIQFQHKKIGDWKFPDTGIVAVDCKTRVKKWIIEPGAGKKLAIVLQTGIRK